MNNDFMSTVTSLLSNPGALDAIKQIASSAGTTAPKPVAQPSPLFADLSEQPARNTSPDNSFIKQYAPSAETTTVFSEKTRPKSFLKTAVIE